MMPENTLMEEKKRTYHFEQPGLSDLRLQARPQAAPGKTSPSTERPRPARKFPPETLITAIIERIKQL